MARVARIVAERHGLETPGAFADDDSTLTEEPWEQALAEAPWCGPDALGEIWERLLTIGSTEDRRERGAHFTPRSVADAVIGFATDRRRTDSPLPETVWDPAAGGGAFLLAAARALHSTGGGRVEAVNRLYATDIDPIALAVCDAALEIWSGGLARPRYRCADALLDDQNDDSDWPVKFDLVVGNPPFLSQLSSDTSRSRDRADLLRQRYPEVSKAYLDDAGLFVKLGVDRLANGGLAALIVPTSLLGAADARPLRKALAEATSLTRLWIDADRSFDAQVDVVALILERVEDKTTRTRVRTGHEELDLTTPGSDSWAPLLAATQGVPTPTVSGPTSLAGHGRITAGFRQHFYGIANAVSEEPETAKAPTHRLITAGAIDPLMDLWGERSIKFGGERWDRPVLDLDAIEDPAVQGWFRDRNRPKILLASQTRVIEAIVDETGMAMPSVPVISLEPDDPAQLWHLVAALCSPAASAWLVARAAGTGMSADAVRVRAAELAELRLPRRGPAWDEGAEAAKRAHRAGYSDPTGYVEAMHSMGKSMDSAYGVDRDVGPWWWSRLRLPIEGMKY